MLFLFSFFLFSLFFFTMFLYFIFFAVCFASNFLRASNIFTAEPVCACVRALWVCECVCVFDVCLADTAAYLKRITSTYLQHHIISPHPPPPCPAIHSKTDFFLSHDSTHQERSLIANRCSPVIPQGAFKTKNAFNLLWNVWITGGRKKNKNSCSYLNMRSPSLFIFQIDPH